MLIREPKNQLNTDSGAVGEWYTYLDGRAGARPSL
jgi:hypothetical protein